MSIRRSSHNPLLPGLALMLLLAALSARAAPSTLAGEAPANEASEPAESAPAHPIIKIDPVRDSFDINNPAAFDIFAPTGNDYIVELTLAKWLFNEPAAGGSRRTTGADRNFYRSSVHHIETMDHDSFQVPEEIWQNLRGSRVFFRLISYAPSSPWNQTFTTSNAEWNSAPSVERSGAAWYGLPLNDQAFIGGTAVVLDGRLNGKAISSDYGPRNAPGGSRFHAGLDIPVSVGTPVYAVADGVVQSDPGLSSDHILVLRHSDHFKTGYAHLESWLVEIDPNELITQGQLIGYSGDWVSNAHKSPHLHIDSGYDIVDGKASGALFYNPLHYLPYTNVYSNGISNFTSNTTRGRAIDIEPAAGDQDKVLVAFGLTTGYDKDLNYIKVQVDGRTDRGQYFVLNYDEVIKQDSNTGVVDLSNGRRFRIRDDDIYNDAALGYDFYVVPGSTTINQTASDHFFFPWDMTPFMIGEDEGPLDIVITAEEVNGARKEWNATVGAEISPIESEVNGRQLTIRFDVTYHDVMSGSIHLEAKGIPAGWSAAFDHQNLNLAPEEQAQVTLTLTAPNLIEPDVMKAEETRIVAFFNRLPALQDTEVICPASGNINAFSTAAASQQAAAGSLCPMPPGSVVIVSPPSSEVLLGEPITVKVNAPGAEPDAVVKLSVENSKTGAVEELAPIERAGDDVSFRWTPQDAATDYILTAYAEGLKPSQPLKVWTRSEMRFLEPSAGSVVMGKPITIKVEAQGMDDISLMISPSDGGHGGWMTETTPGRWEWSSWEPKSAGREYTLSATGYPSNGHDPVTVDYAVRAMPAKPVINVASPLTRDKPTQVEVSAPDAIEVELKASGSVEMTQSGYDEQAQSGDGIWKFKWTPDIAGHQTITADVNYALLDRELIHKEVLVIDENQNSIEVIISEPMNGAVLLWGVRTPVRIESPGELIKASLEITDAAGNVVFEKSVTAQELGGNFSEVAIDWAPSKEGDYLLKATAWDPTGYKGWTEDEVRVTVESPGAWSQINDFTYLWENKKPISGLRRHGYGFDHTVWLNTGISSSEYVCGVVGYESWGGDIGEKSDHHDIVDVFMAPSDGSWKLMADFNTWHSEDLFNGIFSDRPEKWNVKVMCFSSEVAAYGDPQPGKPIFIKRFDDRGDNVGIKTSGETHIPTDQFICGVAGFGAEFGDIQESGRGDIIQAFMSPGTNTWQMRADFRSHDDGKNSSHEDWDLSVLCVDRTWAAQDNPETGKPFVFKTYVDQGDNFSRATEFSVADWECGITGFAALHGDINENSSSNALMDVRMSPGSQVWHLRADFRTHKGDHETWNMHVMCVAKLPEAAPQLSAEPAMFPSIAADGWKYGPGMRLTWDETHNPYAAGYMVQYSEDGGGTWKTYHASREISYGGWINHHGNLDCGHGFGHCLKPLQNYSYRVAPVDAQGNLLSDWSPTVTQRSMDWPANVQLGEPEPAGPYLSDEEVTLRLVDIHGPGLRIQWKLSSWSGAEFNIISGCQDGLAVQNSVNTCTLLVWENSTASAGSEFLAANAFAPSKIVRVDVTGEDTSGYRMTDYRVLSFKDNQGGKDTPSSPFADVSSNHWVEPYTTYLYNHGYIAGIESGEALLFEPQAEANRFEMSVFLVRASHQEPGYVPVEPAVEQIFFEDKKPADVASFSSNAEAEPALGWGVKWSEELNDLGLTSGCSINPPLFCGEAPTTRAQAATFFEKVLHGAQYAPPEVQSSAFQDVPLLDQDRSPAWAPKWIEQALADGLVQSCGTDMDNMLFRPDAPVTRAEAACMLYHTLQARGDIPTE